MACVYIPVQNSEEEVRVSLDQLPRDATDILDILKAEQAPLDLWLVIAREYFKQGKIEQFCQILEEGSSPEIDEYYADVRYERIAILNALGAYYSYIGKIETSLKEKDNHFAKATQYYNRASRIDMHESSTWVGKGQLLLAKGDVEQAFNTFKIVLDGDPDNVPALLGQASVQFNRGRYSESLELYKRALRVYPDCPGAVRLGIGLCRYKLGHFERARQAFERVLQLDPENVEALVALGVMDLHANDAAGIRRGMERMLLAFQIYPYNALSLNYLANHFFFTGQHFLVEQLTETALAVTNHGPTKAHSYYNLARSYHSKGDYEKAGRYYMASVKESSKPQEFVLPYYGLGQVQLKLGDYRSALANFEKVLEVYPENCETLKALGHIYAILHQTDKALEVLRKVTRIDPRDSQAFLDLGEILISSDTGAALEAYKTARSLLRKLGEDVPIDLLNNIGVLHFERGEFELAEQTFKDALGNGVWHSLINGKENTYAVDAVTALLQYKDVNIFFRLEEVSSVELPWNKVSTIFNLARLFEESHKTLSAILLYRLILYKYPEYVDALLRLAAIAKARSNIQLSIELVGEALRVNDKCPGALAILGCLELKNDEWVKAKETFRAASEAADGKDFYASVCLGNWNYFAALVSELKKQVKHIPVHLEKAKDIYSNVLKKCTTNLYAANGLGMILAEKGQFDVSKEIFTQVQEAGSGTIFSQMPDVWINLAHVYFAQGNYTLAIKMYQNCLRKFFYNTESQIFLYLARTHYEAEQWQDSKRTLLRAIHLSPSNYTLRFNLGVVMQKFSASLLNKEKRSADEMRTTVAELEIAISVFGQLAVAFNQNIHGIDEKKIETHVSYCKHLLDVAKVYREAAELEEQQSRQRLELARQVTLAEEARRKAEEQQRLQMEKRKQEEELKRVKELEERFERVKEQLKISSNPSKRRERAQSEDEEGEHSEKKRRKGGKKKRRDKSEKSHYETEEVGADRVEFQEDMDEHHEYGEPTNQLNTAYDDEEDIAQDPLAAVGLEDSDAEEEMGAPTTASRRRQAWAASDEDEPVYRQEDSSPQQQEAGTLRDDENGANIEAEDDVD